MISRVWQVIREAYDHHYGPGASREGHLLAGVLGTAALMFGVVSLFVDADRGMAVLLLVGGGAALAFALRAR